ncbi:hypothetical protein BDFB_011450 [Asbolus verrucosus]|uniref:Uncharacterized protein n=1 Tax=Asbolus verrucosus TaxID=1661398 RepID=A0A482VEN4_ASBVE|nr:hypothetical protein BDFB_011450 [Asbolus verrucosus]
MEQANIERCLKGMVDYEDIKHIIDVEWPEECFRCTNVVVGNPLSGKRNFNQWARKEDPQMEQGLSKICKQRYPEIQDINTDQGIAYMTTMTKYKNTEGEVQTNEKYIFKVESGETSEDLWNRLKLLKQEMEKKERYRVPIPKQESMEQEVVKKFAEAVFREFNIMVNIQTKK